jgi:hypothetical protein
MKIISFLTIIVLAALTIRAGDAPSMQNDPPPFFKPGGYGDPDHSVYKSPTHVPAITNHWPSTNLPAMTNPPALPPPRGLRVVQ